MFFFKITCREDGGIIFFFIFFALTLVLSVRNFFYFLPNKNFSFLSLLSEKLKGNEIPGKAKVHSEKLRIFEEKVRDRTLLNFLILLNFFLLKKYLLPKYSYGRETFLLQKSRPKLL